MMKVLEGIKQVAFERYSGLRALVLHPVNFEARMHEAYVPYEAHRLSDEQKALVREIGRNIRPDSPWVESEHRGSGGFQTTFSCQLSSGHTLEVSRMVDFSLTVLGNHEGRISKKEADGAVVVQATASHISELLILRIEKVLSKRSADHPRSA